MVGVAVAIKRVPGENERKRKRERAESTGFIVEAGGKEESDPGIYAPRLHPPLLRTDT